MYQINLLGRFQMIKESKVLNEDNIRSEMLIKLLAYMVIHRNRVLTMQELSEALWHVEQTDNPIGALKNLMYRLRLALKNMFGEETFIITGRGAYHWNHEIEVELDVEELEKTYFRVKELGENNPQSIFEYEEIARLYRGYFLESCADMQWVVPLSSYYHSLFSTGMKKALVLYQKKKQFEDMERICAKVLMFDALDEQIHVFAIKALIQQNKREMAMKYYKRSREMLQKELGISQFDKLQEVYREILAMKKATAAAQIEEIHSDMLEGETEEGAYFCGYSVFKEIYRIEARKNKRLDLSEYVLLFTVILKNMDKKKTEFNQFLIKRTMKKLGEILKKSLRTGDVTSCYSDSQYIVMLPTCNYEDSIMIANRILEKLYGVIDRSQMRVKVDVEKVVMKYPFQTEQNCEKALG